MGRGGREGQRGGLALGQTGKKSSVRVGLTRPHFMTAYKLWCLSPFF